PQALTHRGAARGGDAAPADDADDASEVPEELVAVTENVYDAPAVRPVTVHSVGPAVQVQVRLSGEDVTV
ncbi:MAG: hypothetical protein VW685_10135, partial [Ilumatobacter sp.]